MAMKRYRIELVGKDSDEYSKGLYFIEANSEEDAVKKFNKLCNETKVQNPEDGEMDRDIKFKNIKYIGKDGAHKCWTSTMTEIHKNIKFYVKEYNNV